MSRQFPATAIVAAMVLALVCDGRAADEPQQAQSSPASNRTLPATAASPDAGLAALANSFSFIAATHSNPLGVEVAPVDKALAVQLDLPPKTGVVVRRVTPATDNAKTALALHDVILKIDDHPVPNPEKFHELVKAEPGKELRCHIVRQARPIEIAVQVPKMALYELAAGELLAHAGAQDNQYRVGVTLAPADDTLRSQLRLAEGEGLVVTDVVPDGPAAKAGVRKHDVLTLLDGKRLTTVDAVNSQVQSIKDRKVTVVFFRSGQEMSRELAPKLSTAPVTNPATIAYSATFLNQLQNPNLVWEQQSLFPYRLNNVSGTAILSQPYVHWATPHEIIKTTSSPADQVAELKKQLDQMQKTLQSLEATLRPPTTGEKPAPAPEKAPEKVPDKQPTPPAKSK
jgi:hypothetical protein